MMDIKKSFYSILFIEDEDLIRENYVRYLSQYYENVYEAKDGFEAYELYKKLKPDILIVDINLPKMTGLELMEKIRKNDHSTKAIVLTAHSEVDYLLKATELKLTKYLVKPISRSDLKDALNIVNEEMQMFEVKMKKYVTLSNGFFWNKEFNELYNQKVIVFLTPQEKKIVRLFIENISMTLTYENIIIEVWDFYEFNKIDALKTTIKNLRKKIPSGLIVNVYGIGYKMVNKE